MAREFALVRTAILADDDYRDLTQGAQHLYLHLLIKADLTQCGVADWRPKRIAAYTAGLTAGDVEAAAAELVTARFIVTDEDTEEVLVRTFIRHDGILKQPNMAVAMANAYAAVGSSHLRGVIVHELRRLHHRSPDLPGWRRSQVTDLLEHRAVDPFEGVIMTIPNPSGNPSVYPSGKGSVYPSVEGQSMGSGNPSHAFSLPLPLQTLPTKPPTDEPALLEIVTTDGAAVREPKQPTKAPDPAFAAFWETYPRREGKAAAVKAWEKAIRRADRDRILAGAARYRDDPNREPEFTKHPTSWLNADCWDDDPLPPRSRPLASVGANGQPIDQARLDDMRRNPHKYR